MTTATKNAQAYIEAARALKPRVRELAPQIEREGKLPQELVEAFTHEGFFHMLLPRDLGGVELNPVSVGRIIEEISSADGSAGWALMIAAQCTSFAGLMPAEDARDVFGNGGIAAGTANPLGRAVWTDTPAPGYIVTGRWPFASGSDHASWFAAECMVFDGDAPRLNDGGEHVSRMLFVPREQVTIIETWDTLGLRGTASNDFAIDAAFVPAQRGFQMLVTEPYHTWALYRADPLIFLGHGAQSLGLARGAIESAVEIAGVKRGWGNVPLRETPRIQAVIAEATALVDAASHYLYDTAQELWDLVLSGGYDATLRACVRLATSHANRASLQAVDLLHGTLATSAVFKKSALERQFRDIHTAAAHVMIGPLTYEAAGRVLLGLDAQFPFF